MLYALARPPSAQPSSLPAPSVPSDSPTVTITAACTAALTPALAATPVATALAATVPAPTFATAGAVATSAAIPSATFAASAYRTTTTARGASTEHAPCVAAAPAQEIEARHTTPESASDPRLSPKATDSERPTQKGGWWWRDKPAARTPFAIPTPSIVARRV